MDQIIELTKKIPLPILLGLSATSVILGDFFAKSWSVNQKPFLYIVTIIFYVGSGYFYIPTLLKEDLVVTSAIWSLLSIIGFMVIGLIIFKEKLEPREILGVVLGVVALIIFALPTKNP